MWNDVCAKIFIRCIQEFEKNNIRYFVLRNYELLPFDNLSKDVDIMVEPQKINSAKVIVKKVYYDFGLIYYDEAVFHRLYCTHGINENGTFGIHIDLIAGYLVRGYEIYTFDQLYDNTEQYHGFYILNELYQGIMLLITKIFGYKKVYLNEKYKNQIVKIYKNNMNQFNYQLEQLLSKQTASEFERAIRESDFEKILSTHKILDKELKRYARKKQPLRTLKNNMIFLWGRWNRVVYHKNRFKRAVAVVSTNKEKREMIAERIMERINRIYVDEKKTHIYIDGKGKVVAGRLRHEMSKDIHYDKVSLIVTEKNKLARKMFPDTVIFNIDDINISENMKRVEDYFVKKYMDTYLEKIG